MPLRDQIAARQPRIHATSLILRLTLVANMRQALKPERAFFRIAELGIACRDILRTLCPPHRQSACIPTIDPPDRGTLLRPDQPRNCDGFGLFFLHWY